MRHIGIRTEDTIVAVATPPGQGGIGIVRISGPDALTIGRDLFSFAANPVVIESHRMYPGTVALSDDSPTVSPPPNGPTGDDVVDRGLFVYMAAPRSYTGDDVVELQCHGSPMLLWALVAAAVRHGARAADRGEFTRRAFMNGKIDLAQAEAVADLIAAQSVDSLPIFSRHLMGGLSDKIGEVRGRLVVLLGGLEAAVDFSDQDIQGAPHEGIVGEIEAVLASIVELIATYRTGRIYREGLSLVITGRPNVGKSSLMNALLGRPRAIVDEEPGTTTDTIEDVMNLGGFPVKVVDTCGLRGAGGVVEQEGVRRAREAIGTADLVLVVGEARVGIGDEERWVLDRPSTGGSRPLVLVMNKVDLVRGSPHPPISGDPPVPVVFTSALVGTGIGELKDMIALLIAGGARPGVDETLVITNARHYEALLRASRSLEEVLKGASAGLGPEFLAVDLRGAVSALGEVTGEVTTDQVLEAIFSRFCIGK